MPQSTTYKNFQAITHSRITTGSVCKLPRSLKFGAASLAFLVQTVNWHKSVLMTLLVLLFLSVSLSFWLLPFIYYFAIAKLLSNILSLHHFDVILADAITFKDPVFSHLNSKCRFLNTYKTKEDYRIEWNTKPNKIIGNRKHLVTLTKSPYSWQR